MIKDKNSIPYNKSFSFFLLFVLIFLVYSNTFNSSWQYDDYPNIVYNSNLHIKSLELNSLSKTFFASPVGPGNTLYRPVPCFTLALNWYFGENDVTGYHLVNVIIHLLSAFFLFLSILNLLKSPNFKGRYKESEYFIALFAATLWAVNPIQTGAVTYIVQRMASLAGMFYILSIYFYVKARNRKPERWVIFYFAGCLVSLLLAVGSKENTITLPIALVFIEYIFYQRLKLLKTVKRIIFYSLAIELVVIIIYLLCFKIGKDPISFFNDLLITQTGYDDRSFTMAQRLISFPRVIFFYMSQIFYPIPSSFSIAHDFSVSKTLFNPFTTLPALFIVVFLIVTGFFLIRKQPVISFAILFFFLNHVIESTILSLTLVFEHRNYIPSFFLFVPIAIGLKSALDYYRFKKRYMYIIIIFFLTFLIIGFGTGTYIRNSTWLTEKSLWEDAAKKAPGRAGPIQKIAEYYKNHGIYDKAIILYDRALSLKSQNVKQSQVLSINNIGVIYARKNEPEKAIQFFLKALDVFPGTDYVRYNLARVYIETGTLDQALFYTNLLLQGDGNNPLYLNLKGFVLLKQNKLKTALQNFRMALELTPKNINLLLNMGRTLSLMEDYKRAHFFLNQAHNYAPENITTFFCLMENSIRSEDKSNLDKYTEELLSVFTITTIMDTLKEISENNSFTPVSSKILLPMIAETLNKKSNSIIKL